MFRHLGNQPSAWIDRGIIFMLEGKSEEAEMNFARSLLLAPQRREELDRRKQLVKKFMNQP